jgi:hypothetical protein
MINGKVVVAEEDYDTYLLHLPWSVIRKNKREEYILGELEKVHPCFSPRFDFKSEFVLGKNGKNCKVLVMDKLKISDYKSRFPGKKMWIKRFRVSYEDFGKRKKFFFLSALFFGLILLFFLGLWQKGETLQKVETLPKQNSEWPEVLELPAAFDGDTGQKTIEDLLTLVSENEGKITAFDLQSSLNEEKISASLINIYPEKLEAFLSCASTSNVTFVNENPRLELEMKVKKKKGNSSLFMPLEVIPLVRQRAIKWNGKILREDWKKACLNFEFEKQSDYANFIREAGGLMEVKGPFVKRLKVSGGKKLSVEVFLTQGEDGLDKSLIEKASLLLQEEIIKEEKVPVKAVAQGLKKNEKSAEESGLELGRISRSSGEEIIFYRNADGKIKKKILEVKNERKSD